MQTANTLHRKQYLVSKANLEKIASIQAMQGKSATEIVREAIDAYDPAADKEEQITPEAVAFLSEQVQAAISQTEETNAKVEALIVRLEERE